MPPVPWRRIAFATLVLVVALTAAGLFAIPRIDSSKKRSERSERQALTERQRAARQRLLEEQRPVRGVVPAARRSEPGEGGAARGRLLRAVEHAITANARSRVDAGSLKGPILRTECEPAPGASAVFDCVAVNSDIRASRAARSGLLGYSFRAVVDLRRSTYVFCKVSPPPGEGAAPDPRDLVTLPRPCRRR